MRGTINGSAINRLPINGQFETRLFGNISVNQANNVVSSAGTNRSFSGLNVIQGSNIVNSVGLNRVFSGLNAIQANNVVNSVVLTAIISGVAVTQTNHSVAVVTRTLSHQHFGSGLANLTIESRLIQHNDNSSRLSLY